ncbi:MAG: GFA family protein [Steroidobacter sp.]
MSTQTYKGSCHCGAVRIEADIDLSAGSGRCNCSICSKTRAWGTTVKPDAFRLMQGADDLSAYEFGSRSAQHRFCKHCGVQVYTSGYVPEIGGEFRSVKIACLDELPPETLAAIPVRYMDGRNDNWFEEPAVTKHL